MVQNGVVLLEALGLGTVGTLGLNAGSWLVASAPKITDVK